MNMIYYGYFYVSQEAKEKEVESERRVERLNNRIHELSTNLSNLRTQVKEKEGVILKIK